MQRTRRSLSKWRCPTAAWVCVAWMVSALAAADEPLHRSVNFDEVWYYTADPVVPHCLQTYRLFVPDATHTMPAEGWPVLINLDLAVFQYTDDIVEIPCGTCVTTAFEPTITAALDQGIAVVAARATPSLVLADPYWDTLCPASGAPDIPGHGLFHPPGYTPAGAGFAPYDDPLYDMAEKDAVMMVQHVRHLARGTGGASRQEIEMAKLDHRRIAVHGSSAGAASFMWTSLGPDRRLDEPFSTYADSEGGQWSEWTRPDAVVFGNSHVWWPFYNTSANFPAFHWGSNGDLETAANSYGDADLFELIAGSALAYEECGINDELASYFYDNETTVFDPPLGPLDEIDYTKNPSATCGDPLLPFCFDFQGTETNVHPVWNGIVWTLQYPATRLTTGSPTTAVQEEAEAAGIPDVPYFTPWTGEREADIAAWLRARFDAEPDPWSIVDRIDLDGSGTCTPIGTAGTAGVVPTIEASGALVVGQPFQIDLAAALPDATVYLLMNFARAPVEALGGIVVPDLINAPYIFELAASPAGTVSFSIPWPNFEPGTTIYAQYFVVDPAAPASFAITPAVFGVSP